VKDHVRHNRRQWDKASEEYQSAHHEDLTRRALAWGARLGICDAAFVETLRSLPPPGANGEPDLRPVVRDLGMPAYTQGRCTNDVSNGTPVK